MSGSLDLEIGARPSAKASPATARVRGGAEDRQMIERELKKLSCDRAAMFRLESGSCQHRDISRRK